MSDNRIVHGKYVVDDRPTPAPFNAKDGRQVHWRQIRTLMLHTGEVLYGCAHCDYTNSNLYSVRPHLNAHRTDKKTNGRGKRTKGSNGHTADADAEDMPSTLRGLMQQLSQLEQVQQERDEWKQRAEAAERRVHAARRALGSEDT